MPRILKNNDYLLYVLVVLLCCACSTNVSQYKVKNGAIDLSTYDFEKDSKLSLQGDWNLYWTQSPLINGVFDSSLLKKSEPIKTSWKLDRKLLFRR